ncbi:MAG: hypothetical protein KGH71_06230, partial [Candidatus Micrarchaeota archaeon]|nr:hypothetical protein [Candidatus Micrarchaeota archaeon]
MSNVKQTPEQKQKKIESMQTEKKFGHATVLSGIFEQIMSPAMDQKVLSDYMNKLKEHVGPGNILQMNKTPGIYSDIHSNKIEWYLRTEEKGIEGTDLIFAARIIGEHGGVKHIALQVNKEGALEISEDPVKVKM